MINKKETVDTHKLIEFFINNVGQYVLCNKYETGVFIKNKEHAIKLHARQSEGLFF